MATATDRLLIPSRHFSQFQRKRVSYKAKALIKEEVNLEKILEKILVGEIRVIFKKLWMVASKLWIVLKKMLMSKREKGSLERDAQKRNAIQLILSIKGKIISINTLEEPRRIQKTIYIRNGETMELQTRSVDKKRQLQTQLISELFQYL